ncbi:NAD(+) diphosphatase [Methanofollis fontis]|uniref:NAD(+) diphosphatase n=1 Tax=Methanofollis fontis TaxID=2052832 RepID=A0A483CQY5_9EURY|nr:NAD(+) diphosphatase [Methanofollis fontis]TAJ43352.1 NAD(+) diphosphatase [Methanofollis fontis]
MKRSGRAYSTMTAFVPHYATDRLVFHDPDPTDAPPLYVHVVDAAVVCGPGGRVLHEAPPDGCGDASIPLGSLDGRQVFALGCEAVPEGFRAVPLRDLFGLVDDETLGIAGRAVQCMEFDRTHRYCGRCGTETRMKEDEIARVCPSCGLVVYPVLSPAVIVRVVRGDRILLARSPGFPRGRYSVIAGFVEPGETLEHAVQREVAEETGISVANLRYFGSQPWPFPHSLMIGFTADYAGGEVRPDGVEVEEAAWFTADSLPDLPGRASISRALIDDWLEEQ